MTPAIDPAIARSRLRVSSRWPGSGRGRLALDVDGNVFFGLNTQDRRYVDVPAWESQNWGMLAVDRPVRSTDRFTVMSMISVRGLHHRPAGFAAAVADRRKLQPGPASSTTSARTIC